MGVGDLQRVRPAGVNIVGRIDSATLEKTPRSDPNPPCHLVEPGAVLGGNVADRRRGWSAPEGPSLPTSVSGLRHQGPVAPLRHPTADLKAPGGMELLHHPVVARQSGEWLDDVGPRRGAVCTGACLAQRPDALTGGDDTRGHQGTHPRPAVLGLAFCWWARGQGLWRVGALQHLPAGLFLGANDPTPLRKEAEGMEGEGPHRLRLGRQGWGVAVEPSDTAMGVEVRLSQQTPETGTTPRPAPSRLAGGAQVVKAPTRGRAVVRRGCMGGQRPHCQPLCGGKSAAADPGAAHLAGA